MRDTLNLALIEWHFVVRLLIYPHSLRAAVAITGDGRWRLIHPMALMAVSRLKGTFRLVVNKELNSRC